MFKNAVSSAFRFFLATLLVTLVAAALGVAPARAASPLFVKPDAVGDCSSWANACSLQTALTGASSGDEIWVAVGIYTPTTGSDRTATFQLKNGVTMYGGFAGTETLLTQRDLMTGSPILSGEIGAAGTGDNSYHVVTGATGATLDDFSIMAGNADGSSPDNSGGGMYNSASSPMLVNVTFSANMASMFGAGMYNDQGSSPVLTNVTFVDNLSNMYGGGMFNNNSSNPVLTNVTFSSNQAAMSGGGMQNNSSNPVLTNVTFSANQATNPTFGSAGGMFNGNSSPIIRNTLFWGNTAPNGSTSEQQISDFGNTPNVDYSVVEGGYASGTNIISTDPNLGALNWYGGFTITVPLLPGSSAIDATSSNCPFYDQRGMGRSWPTCDIGAFEYPDFFPDAPRIDTPTENSYTQLLRPLISGTAGSAQAYATVTVKEVAATICTTTAALDGSWSCTPGADLSEALHTISVTQTDLSTQESIASTLSFTVDATAPSAPRIDMPTENSYINGGMPLISGTAGAAEAYATVTVNEDSATLCSAVADVDGSWICAPGANLSEGLHTISVTQTDLANNTSLASTRNFTVDMTNPSAPRIDTPAAGSYTNLVRPLISGTAGAAEANATVTVNEDSATLCSTVADVDGSWSCSPGKDLSGGLHTISVTQTDLANNTSLASTRSFTIPYLVYLPVARH